MAFAFSLIKKERIGGLEINEACVLFSLVSLNREDGKRVVLEYAEESLKKGAIANGIIADSGAVTNAVKKILKKISARVPYCILSIPGNAVYTTIISLPSSLEERRMEEAIKLAVDLELPFGKEESYCDSEELERSERGFFLLIAAKKAVIDPYIACAMAAGIKPIAVEFYERSVARIVAARPGASMLTTAESPSQGIAFIVKDKKLRLTQVLGNAADIPRMKNFYETEYEKIGAVSDIRSIGLEDEWNKKSLPKNASRWYGALGAALRGALPRQDDAYPSLMAVGTKEAFRYERALAFTHLLSSMTIGVALFFIAAFIGAWIFLSSVSDALLKPVSGNSTLLIPEDIAESEEEVQKFSEFLSLAKGFATETPRWSNVLDNLQKSIPETVTITSLSVTSPTEAATIGGVAKKRTDLNQLKKRVEKTDGIRNASLPLTNLDIKENIPFTITFYFEDTTLYGPE